ncbi:MULTISPECIES: M56 family metallopeptidase [unclassified Gordonia (in: high G+C Gram-positive bacteria)]|uniref:M56 family metallopeptidase n=1 Tax=unclassified Gordonia (in: high G+C Gram-positive bacteria) TaxID=2657482 RepID=UPI001FFF9AD8|nr:MULTISPECIES: M56 family metallopeptidase [unclassified Gordonia (in: high G+C Gram-positive bacteria)]UQE76705.1 M56 family metallopeptidase [Gordonia sp. PP30]
MTALLFGILTVALVGPIPEALARAEWPLYAPRAAMTLWQSIALAAVLSAFSTGLAIAANLLAPGPDGTPTTTLGAELHRLGWFTWSVYMLVFAATLVIGVRLTVTVMRIGARTRARRRRHRTLIDLVDRVDLHRHAGADIRVLDVPVPMAYCLPGLRSRVVLSEGVLARLSADELAAVIEHERAHLRARHDLVLEAFIALHAAFPRFVRSRSALSAVELLAEALADDQAVRVTGRTTVGRALVACADATAPRGAMAVGGPTTITRVRRLIGPQDRRRRISVTAYTLAAALLVVPTLAVVIPWLTELQRLVSH